MITRRKPLARSTKPIARKSTRPRTKPRTPACPVRGCKRSSQRTGQAGGLCHKHLVAALDKSARSLCMVPDSVCTDKIPHQCNGGLQWAHIASRRLLATRWAPNGAVPLCARRHAYFTNHPDAWSLWCIGYFGSAEKYEDFLRLAHGPYPDLIDVYKELYETVL